MRSYLLASLLTGSLIFLSACKDKSEAAVALQPPANVLSEEKFARVLTDFALAESAANMNLKNVPGQRIDTVYAFDPLKDNQVSKGSYDSTLAFYAQHAELYKKVYEAVLANLSELQTQRDSLKTDSASK